MDRHLRANTARQKRRIYGWTKPGLLLKHQIPVKTGSWDVSTPGFTEVDLVSHSGNSADGEFAHTLNVTDMHASWTASRAVLGKIRLRLPREFGFCARRSDFQGFGDVSGNVLPSEPE